jgi:Slime mold cyclic AMP receptor
MGMSSEEQDKINLTLMITNCLSLAGSLFIIVLYIILKLKIFSFRLVFYIAIADLIHSAGLMLPSNSDPWCFIQAVSLEYTSLSGLFWTGIMAYSIYEAVVKLDTNIQDKEKKFLIIGYGLPIIFTAVPETTQKYGFSGGWCWIVSDEDGYIFRILCFYWVLFSVILYNIIVYCLVYRKLKNGALENIRDKQAKEINHDLLMRLRFYPAVLILCYAAVTIKRIYDVINPGTDNFWVTWVAGLSISLNGILNCIVYGLTKEIKEQIVAFFQNFPNKNPKHSTNKSSDLDELIVNF